MEFNSKNIRIRTLGKISIQAMTEIWNRCWREYYYDMSYSKEHMKVWLELSQVSLQYSTAIYVDNLIIGFTLLSIDKNEGWIAGACIDPNYRSRGLFNLLLRSQLNLATSILLKRVYLEVLEQNYARKAYQSAGFSNVRQLNIYRTQSIADYHNEILRMNSVTLIPLDEYFIYRKRVFNPAWQRRDGYLKRRGKLFAYINNSGTAGALFTGEKSNLLLDVWSSNLEGAKEIVSVILYRSGSALTLINQPDDWITAVLRCYGINPNAKQFEMCAELS